MDPTVFWKAADWYHGPITKEEAHQRLAVKGDGSYLVRDGKVCLTLTSVGSAL